MTSTPDKEPKGFTLYIHSRPYPVKIWDVNDIEWFMNLKANEINNPETSETVEDDSLEIDNEESVTIKHT